MARLLLILALVATVFWVYSVVDCALQPAERHRGVKKSAWIAIVVLLPVVGGLLWFTVGRLSRRRMIAERNAPDDDPTFLQNLGNVSEQDERIRRLEEELAKLDEEDTEGGFGRGENTAADSESDSNPDSDGTTRGTRD